MSDDLEAAGAMGDVAEADAYRYNATLREWLDLYASQPPRQAELVVPAWAMRRFNQLPEYQRREIMGEIDLVASLHGLLTPTKIIVATPPPIVPLSAFFRCVCGKVHMKEMGNVCSCGEPFPYEVTEKHYR